MIEGELVSKSLKQFAPWHLLITLPCLVSDRQMQEIIHTEASPLCLIANSTASNGSGIQATSPNNQIVRLYQSVRCITVQALHTQSNLAFKAPELKMQQRAACSTMTQTSV